MHIQEVVKPALFTLFNLKLAQQANKPLKRFLVTIDPKEINL